YPYGKKVPVEPNSSNLSPYRSSAKSTVSGVLTMVLNRVAERGLGHGKESAGLRDFQFCGTCFVSRTTSPMTDFIDDVGSHSGVVWTRRRSASVTPPSLC